MPRVTRLFMPAYALGCTVINYDEPSDEMGREVLESGNSPWGTQAGQYHSSGLIHCPGHYHQKYSVDHVVECSEISAHGLEKEICPAKLAPKGCWFLVRIGGLSEIISQYKAEPTENVSQPLG